MDFYNVDFFENGNKKKEQWTNEKNELDSLDGPAVIRYTENGDKAFEEWYENGKYHRLDGAAIILYKNGKVSGMAYYNNGKCYRKNNPSIITFHDNGNISKKVWSNRSGEIHRKNGPAIIRYDEDGNIICEEYYIKNKKLTDLQVDVFKALI